MTDVAQAAGVALVTVSRALNQPDKVSPETLARVQAEVRRLGYVPDLIAGSLASARSHIVGAIVPTLSNSWFADTMEGLAAALAPAGYQLMLSQSNYHPQAEAGLVDAFLGRRVDAMVLTGASHDRKVRARLRRLGLPVLETWDLPEIPLDMAVGFSNAGVGLAVGRYLWDKGYRQIGLLGAAEERSHKRMAGLQAALLPHGLRPVDTELLPPPSTIAEGALGLARLLRRSPQIDAVFCSHDLLAVGALQMARRAGIAVPRRLAVVGFSDLAVAEAVSPSLTTVRVRATELGRCAGELLLRRLAGAHLAKADRVVDLGFELVLRESA
jgi:LacI family gluconate utilization system Gnt-I transcriptional repressor